MRHSCLVVGPAGRALIAAAHLGRQDVTNSPGLQCECKERENLGNEELPFLVIMIQNCIFSSNEYCSQVVLACLLCFHWQQTGCFLLWSQQSGCELHRDNGSEANMQD